MSVDTSPPPIKKTKTDGRVNNRAPWQRGRSALVFGGLLRRVESAPPLLLKHRTALLAAVAAMPLLPEDEGQQ